jgi:hypothetical protein
MVQKIEIDEPTIIKDLRDYMTHDGVEAFQQCFQEGNFQQAQIDGWATLHLLPALIESHHLQASNAVILVREALNLFGECPQADLFNKIKEQLPEAFDKIDTDHIPS